jgi:hypothetical protein
MAYKQAINKYRLYMYNYHEKYKPGFHLQLEKNWVWGKYWHQVNTFW